MCFQFSEKELLFSSHELKLKWVFLIAHCSTVNVSHFRHSWISFNQWNNKLTNKKDLPIGCLDPISYRLLFGPYLLPSTVWTLSRTVCCLDPISYRLLFGPYLVPPARTVCCLDPISYCLLAVWTLSRTVCCLDPISYCLLAVWTLSLTVCCLDPISYRLLFGPYLLLSDIWTLSRTVCCLDPISYRLLCRPYLVPSEWKYAIHLPFLHFLSQV
jgi:hypothetical protein